MAATENFRALGTVGTSYKGEYQPEKEYKYANTVYYDGSTYIALIDNPAGEPKDDGVNWKYFARGASGSGSVTSVNGKDGDVKLSASDVSAIPDTDKGSPDGVASLDHDGKVPKDQLPDDIGTGVVSDKFSEDKEYAIGDYCIYNDVLYKFTSKKNAGEWDVSLVEITNVGNEISALNSDLTDSSTGIGFRFGIDSDGNYGYIKAGADTVTPFRFGGSEVSYYAENHQIGASTGVNRTSTSLTLPAGTYIIVAIGMGASSNDVYTGNNSISISFDNINLEQSLGEISIPYAPEYAIATQNVLICHSAYCIKTFDAETTVTAERLLVSHSTYIVTTAVQLVAFKIG